MSDMLKTWPKDFQADRMPVLPHALLQLVRACHNPVLSFQQLAEIIQQDSTIAGRVVAAANAAFYGQSGKINSVERALLVLGTDTLKTLAITLSVQQVFNRFAQIPTPCMNRFWKRSLTSALLAKSMATLTSYPFPDEAYFAGLLHNIGELVLGVQYGEHYYKLLANADSDIEQIAAEHAQFGVNHAQAGAWLAQHWHLDTYVVDALLYHHQPNEQVLDAQHLTKLVHLASILSAREELHGDHILAADLLFGLMPPLVSEICKRIDAEVENIAANLQIHVENSGRQKTQELSDELKMINLLQTARSHLQSAESGAEVMTRVRQAAEILFQTSQSLVFLADLQGRSVVCHPAVHDPALELRIMLQPARSLVTDALLQHELTTWSPDLDQQLIQVIDRQILAILHTPALACIPLQHDNHPCGVLVLGLHHPVNSELRRLMMLFGEEASRVCAPQNNKTVAPAPQSSTIGHSMERAIRETVHEANNPLSIIRNYLEVLARRLDREHEAQHDLQVIREEVDRTARILLNLSQSAQPESFDGAVQVNQVVAQMAQLFRNSILATRSLHCEIACDESIPDIETDEAALRQVLTNLLKNAAEALKPGGIIRIATKDRVNVNGKTFIEICVSDDGPGLPLDVQEHLYQPGHSTKGEGHAGLGLSIVRNLMTGIGGSVSCRSTPAGTEFQLLLPRTLSQAATTQRQTSLEEK